MSLDESSLEHRVVDAGEVRLHVVLGGEGPAVVLLHGFPESWWTWHRVIPGLIAAGFRVVAVDQRGYNLSDRPDGVAAYRIERLVADVVGVLDGLGIARAHVVGHDWGGMIAWAFAMAHPDRLDRLVVLNLPHPRRFRTALWTSRQLFMSWYIGLFQLPVVPEWMLRRQDFAALRKAGWRGRSPDAFTPDDVARYIQAFSQPGALTAAVNWYRALARDVLRGTAPPIRRIDAPTLVIFGERDKALNKDFADPLPEDVPNARVLRIPQASHFVHHDEPVQVGGAIAAFLAG
jgi:pimeloyl-ACP methyl ester carboxylesterase